MAYNINQTINDFLRDGQYRIAELSVEMDELANKGNAYYRSLRKQREQISNLMDVVWWGRHPIIDGYNFTAGGDAWSDDELMLEIQYIRDETNMNPVPYISWNNYNPELVTSYSKSGTTNNEVTGAVFPPGTIGQFLAYNSSGGVYAASFPTYAGAMDSEDIFDYFLDRA